MKKVACYIDGFNLYHAIDSLQLNYLKWLDLDKLAKSFLRQEEELSKVVYFTALMTWEKQKHDRHIQYLNALENSKVTTVVSNFKKVRKSCSSFGRSCNFHEEKQTDVAISSHILSAAVQDNLSRIIIITADSDQIPTLKAMKELSPSTKITLIAPPNRASHSRELREFANDHKEIKVGRLENCLFPRNVLNSSGRLVATSPSSYQK